MIKMALTLETNSAEKGYTRDSKDILKKLAIEKITKNIEANKMDENHKLAIARSSFPKTKAKRIRDEDEKQALTGIALASIEKEKRNGKFTGLGTRRIYDDPSE